MYAFWIRQILIFSGSTRLNFWDLFSLAAHRKVFQWTPTNLLNLLIALNQDLRIRRLSQWSVLILQEMLSGRSPTDFALFLIMPSSLWLWTRLVLSFYLYTLIGPINRPVSSLVSTTVCSKFLLIVFNTAPVFGHVFTWNDLLETVHWQMSHLKWRTKVRRPESVEQDLQN